MPRLYRDAPLNSIWEGSGNVAALDVLRAFAQGARGAARVHGRGRAGRRRERRASTRTSPRSRSGSADSAAEDPQWSARRIVEDMGLALQASLLVRNAPAFVADAFCASRLAGGAASARPPTARCPRAWTPRRSSTARCPL